MAVGVDKIYGPDTANAGRGRYLYRFFNNGGSAEATPVAKVDISTLQAPGQDTARQTVPSKTVVELINYRVTGFDQVTMAWDHTTDDPIAVLRDQGVINFYDIGGHVDPASAGGTGDILISTPDVTSTANTYEIYVWFRTKE